MRLKKGPPDVILLFTTLTLIAIGMIMVFSSSSIKANLEYNDAYYFFKRHGIWVSLGLVAMFICMKPHYQKLKHLALPLLLLAFAGLILLLTPLGIEINGATRWLEIGGFRFTPSEFAKLAVVLFLAHSISQKINKIKSFAEGILPYMIILALACALIMAQPDLGTSVALAGTVFFMLFMAGARISHLLAITVSGVALAGAAIYVADYRMERLIAFLDPWKYAQNEGFQIIQSLYALASGGLFGMGLGRSRQKFFYVPEPHTDFIFAILGEELGFIGAFFIIIIGRASC